jgi:phenylalanyl-tRNA synthetase beta chain
MVLPGDYPLGVPLYEAMGLKDTIFEIGLTPNRADCLSIIGVAREIAAKLGKRVKYPGHEVEEKGEDISRFSSVVIDDPDLCPRYAARYISGCRIAPSPGWLVNRLKAVGLRSINNVVDITNYVLMEYGHPLHAFDFDFLAEGRIVVRRAGQGERFKTLDGQERLLNSSDLTIRDGRRAIAIAGIMGGENSEISDGTTNILLESAYFNPSSTRLTSKRLGLHTDASHRFERGADINVLIRALDRAASLIADLAGGTVAKGVLDAYPVRIEPREITARAEYINRILGLKLSDEDMAGIFKSLEFGVESAARGIFNVSIPSFRVDIEREIDLVEEVARLNGFENIPTTMPVATVFSDLPPVHQRLESRLRNHLASQGFNEVINFSFISPDLFDRIMLDETDPRRSIVRLRNPLVEEQSVMRTTLLPSLLNTCVNNISFRELDQRIFELRRLYLPIQGQDLPSEPLYLGGLLTGMRGAKGWNHEKCQVDFFDAKGVVENILADLNVNGAVFSPENPERFYHPGKSCHIMVDNETIGTIGELHPELLDNFGLTQKVYYFEINFEKLIGQSRGVRTITPPSRFPDTFRDIAMLLADEVSYSRVIDTVRSLKVKEMEEVGIFDLYKGEHVPTGQKSIAIRVIYRSHERTLTDEEVARMHERIVKHLVNELKVTIR